ncbi:hypothetical protein EJ110_NYTH52699 [Nymphaea thermarum]|nr:hypothetical protein EJ110_NYTH52699 [Nymphaea thermarum]
MGPLADQTRPRPPPVEPYRPRAPVENDSDSVYSDDDEFWRAHPAGPVDHRHRRIVERPDRPTSYGVRLDLPEFVGRFDAQEYFDWAYAVQFFFDYHQVEEHHRVPLAATRLRGLAQTWWFELQRSYERRGQRPVQAWGEMQRLMQTKFVPSDHAERAYKEYLNLRQGSRSVADYTAEFHRLSLRVQIVETERQQVTRYVSGLRPSISDEFNCARVDTLDQASSYAMNIEETLKRKHETRVSRGDASYRPKSSFPTRGASSSKPVESKPVPPSPGKGEQSGPAYNTRSKTRSSDQTIRCFRCHELGHLASKCPNSQKKTHLAETIEEPPDSDGKEASSGSSDASSDQDDAVHFDVLEPSAVGSPVDPELTREEVPLRRYSRRTKG